MRFPRPHLPRLAALAAVSVLTVAACGSDTIDNPASSSPTDTVAPADTTGSADSTASAGTLSSADTSSALPKPTVSIPSALPTELVITDLTEGTGQAAKVGDTVLLYYVGVRSADGTEFDSNYDGTAPFEVVLGSQSVIAGWETGLLGVKQGGRRQLDIPSALAYGDQAQGDIIKAGDALSFVVDVVAVVAVGDPADAPDVTVAAGANQEQIGIDDLVTGNGPVVQTGQTAVVQIVAFRADTGEKITSTWEQGAAPFTFVVGKGDVLPGIELAVEGMKVGGRREVRVPYLMAFGEAGNPDFGLPASTDMVLVVDLVSVY
jgi:peptidylprolyl isomerase